MAGLERQVAHPDDRRVIDLEAWMRPLCALVVAGVAAYASTSISGSSPCRVAQTTSVPHCARCARWAVWSAFLLGIAVSLAANVAAAPAMEWKPVLVAGWPPVALLPSVELLVHRPDDRRREQDPEAGLGGAQEALGAIRSADRSLLELARVLEPFPSWLR